VSAGASVSADASVAAVVSSDELSSLPQAAATSASVMAAPTNVRRFARLGDPFDPYMISPLSAPFVARS
jgi:hypothetical protein